MIIAGVMSGTSADGVDVAVCRITAGPDAASPRVKLLRYSSFAYPKAVRAAVLGAMNAEDISTAELARLNWRLGEIYADAVSKACAAANVRGKSLSLVGCHGQTVYHQGIAAKYLGAEVRATWQVGEASVIAERLRVPVVSDFRPADLAAGGQGAPLVPMLDYVMFRSEKVSRILQNLGGIGNLTALPAGCSADGAMAFDTGPGNMVIDGCMERLYGKHFDRGGAVGRRGGVLTDVVQEVLRRPYFSAPPPKSCGREEFGSSFVDGFISRCRKVSTSDADVVATATALTAESVLLGYRSFVWAHVGQAAPLAKVEYVVAGGGAKNAALMDMLREGFGALGVKVRVMEDLGVPAQAKEGVAFALLAWLTWHRLPGNVVAATGATRPVILGKVTF
ncbi:anhydro-N-acetylmuramic acid kinase [Granulicella arctica]|uniref:anhydro-N-acetylmuramic acid kinase n=1 Tax=Granulicella arctica TaxID=940613 RepID=UPI0021E08BB7|nr:anhydro-N-acetylmuramic acid kinase [Granulicella arctica]